MEREPYQWPWLRAAFEELNDLEKRSGRSTIISDLGDQIIAGTLTREDFVNDSEWLGLRSLCPSVSIVSSEGDFTFKWDFGTEGLTDEQKTVRMAAYFLCQLLMDQQLYPVKLRRCDYCNQLMATTPRVRMTCRHSHRVEKNRSSKDSGNGQATASPDA